MKERLYAKTTIFGGRLLVIIRTTSIAVILPQLTLSQIVKYSKPRHTESLAKNLFFVNKSIGKMKYGLLHQRSQNFVVNSGYH